MPNPAVINFTALGIIFRTFNAVELSRVGRVCKAWRQAQKDEWESRKQIQIIRFPPASETEDVIKTYFFDNLWVKPRIIFMFYGEDLSMSDKYFGRFKISTIIVACKRLQTEKDVLNKPKYESLCDIDPNTVVCLVIPLCTNIIFRGLWTTAPFGVTKPAKDLKKFVKEADSLDKKLNANLILFGTGHVNFPDSHSVMYHLRKRFSKKKSSNTVWGGNNWAEFEKNNKRLTRSEHVYTMCINLHGPNVKSWAIILNYVINKAEFDTQLLKFNSDVVIDGLSYGFVNAIIRNESLQIFEERMKSIIELFPRTRFTILLRECSTRGQNYQRIHNSVVGLKFQSKAKNQEYLFYSDVISLMILTYS